MTITTREAEVVDLVKRGYSNKQIAAELGISPLTVRDHISAAAKHIEGRIPARRKLMIASATPLHV